MKALFVHIFVCHADSHGIISVCENLKRFSPSDFHPAVIIPGIGILQKLYIAAGKIFKAHRKPCLFPVLFGTARQKDPAVGRTLVPAAVPPVSVDIRLLFLTSRLIGVDGLFRFGTVESIAVHSLLIPVTAQAIALYGFLVFPTVQPVALDIRLLFSAVEIVFFDGGYALAAV